MRERILSSLVGLMILAVVYAFLDTLLLNLVIGFICVVGVLELLSATGCIQFRGLVAVSMLLTLTIPFARAAYVRPILVQLMFSIVVVLFLLLLKNFGRMSLAHFSMAFLFSVVVPLFFSCAVYIRDDYGAQAGGFYLLVALGSAWLCDTCALFTGLRFGKHKMAPRISPKKTVEGAVGGLVGGTLLMLLLAWAYGAVLAMLGAAVHINYPMLALLTPVFSAAGMLGDLSASVIKREYGVKDFGNIMPGHGGVLDRFDSVLFTLPSVYIAAQHTVLLTL